MPPCEETSESKDDGGTEVSVSELIGLFAEFCTTDAFGNVLQDFERANCKPFKGADLNGTFIKHRTLLNVPTSRHPPQRTPKKKNNILVSCLIWQLNCVFFYLLPTSVTIAHDPDK